MNRVKEITALSILTLGFLLTGCISAPSRIQNTEVLNPDEGLLLILSDRKWLETDRKITPLIQLFYRPLGHWHNTGHVTFSDDENLALVRLPVGKYELNQASYVGGYLRFPEGTKFSIEAGKITYIGNFSLEVTWGFLFRPTRLVVTDNTEKAVKILAAKYPDVSDKYPIISEVLDLEIGRK
jgi:hypothetical protein